MKILKDHSLKELNAFHVDIKAKYVAFIDSQGDLQSLLTNGKYNNLRTVILGESSGTLFSEDFEGLVIKMNIKGIEIIEENNNRILIKSGAGVVWDELVSWSVKRNYQGIENMSAIPGTVGAAPVQNIAAYGQEFAKVFDSLTAIELKTGKKKIFSRDDLKFKYRDSIFKNELKDKYIITHVNISLHKSVKLETSYHSRYESINDELKKVAEKPYSLEDVRKAVISIRKRKFPDWKIQGNTGSFFKNPFITKLQLKYIQEKYPEVQYYPVEGMLYPEKSDKQLSEAKTVKLAAAWLLDELGWKGKRIGNVGTSPNQALVIINYGGASADEILQFADKMNKDFQKNFGVKLEPEVRII